MPAEEKSVMLRRLLEILVTAIIVAFSSGVMPAMNLSYLFAAIWAISEC